MMDLAEKHARVRAYDDEATRIAFHHFVVERFGGDYTRAVWFADECKNMVEVVRTTPGIYSVKQGEKINFHPRGKSE